MTTEVADFQADVIEASRERPVLVDFWAPWCGPCRQLGPILEKLADEPDAAFTLAKLNTDDNQDVAQRYRISSIPAVKLFVDGEVADEFIGALPEPRVRDWLAAALPSESKRRLEEARALLDAGDAAAAAALLHVLLAETPGNAAASVLLARAIVFEHPEGASALAATSGDLDAELLQTREAVQTVVRLLKLSEDASALPASPAQSAYAGAIAALAARDFEGALKGFIQALRLDRRYDNDGARRACLALFRLLGPASEVARRQRPAFDSALF